MLVTVNSPAGFKGDLEGLLSLEQIADAVKFSDVYLLIYVLIIMVP